MNILRWTILYSCQTIT